MQVITNIFTQKIKVFLEHFQKGGKSKKSGLFTLSGQSADLLRPECRGGGRNAESRKVLREGGDGGDGLQEV